MCFLFVEDDPHGRRCVDIRRIATPARNGSGNGTVDRGGGVRTTRTLSGACVLSLRSLSDVRSLVLFCLIVEARAATQEEFAHADSETACSRRHTEPVSSPVRAVRRDSTSEGRTEGCGDSRPSKNPAIRVCLQSDQWFFPVGGRFFQCPSSVARQSTRLVRASASPGSRPASW